MVVQSPVTVQRLRPATSTDPYSGVTQADWTLIPASVDVELYAVAPVSTGERIEANRQPVLVEAEAFAPVGVDVLPGDRVVHDGRTWQVVGEPQQWRSPYSTWEAAVFKLGRVEG